MNNPIDHDQAFTDSKFRELLHGPDKVPNIYAAYLDLRKEIDDLKKRLRLIALEEYEKPPVEPEEVYSPNTIVIDDKCRKCAGQMRTGKAIEQAFTGSPDFVGGSIVTMSNGGLGKMVDCMKCEDCGWSTTK